ncbi:unnamed protein product, partial [Polarella glacialis]
RLVQTPVPLSYVRHTSRFLSLFMLTLPWALVEQLGFLIVPVTCFASWALFGIFEIGLVIEDPFKGVLKVEVIAKTLEQDIEETLRCLGALDLIAAGALGVDPPGLSESTASEPAQAASSGVEALSPAEYVHSSPREDAPTVSPPPLLTPLLTPPEGLPTLLPADSSSASDSAAAPPGSEPRPAAASPPKITKGTAEEVMDAFRRCDKNGDGFIDRAELVGALQQLDSKYTTDEQIDALMEKDGRLSKSEWVTWASAFVDRRSLQVLRMPSSPLLPADSLDDEEHWKESQEEKKEAEEVASDAAIRGEGPLQQQQQQQQPQQQQENNNNSDPSPVKGGGKEDHDELLNEGMQM